MRGRNPSADWSLHTADPAGLSLSNDGPAHRPLLEQNKSDKSIPSFSPTTSPSFFVIALKKRINYSIGVILGVNQI